MPCRLQTFGERGRERLEARLTAQHGVVDAGQALDEGQHRHARIDEHAPTFDARGARFHDTDFGDAIRRRIAAGSFQIDEDDRTREAREQDLGDEVAGVRSFREIVHSPEV